MSTPAVSDDPLLRIKARALADFRVYCLAVGLSERQFGKLAVGDHQFMWRLEAPDRDVVTGRIEKARRWMLAHPDGPPGPKAAD